jgi:hypothetical protein
MKVRFLFLSCILLSVLFVLSTSIVDAVSQTVRIEAGQKKTKSIYLRVDSVVKGKLSVIGDSNSQIDFYITGPSEEIVVPKERVSVKDFRFTATKEGTYTLHFDNSFSTKRKTVTYNYDVRRYIFGMPQEDFLVILVMIIAAVGIILFVAISRP